MEIEHLARVSAAVHRMPGIDQQPHQIRIRDGEQPLYLVRRLDERASVMMDDDSHSQLGAQLGSDGIKRGSSRLPGRIVPTRAAVWGHATGDPHPDRILIVGDDQLADAVGSEQAADLQAGLDGSPARLGVL